MMVEDERGNMPHLCAPHCWQRGRAPPRGGAARVPQTLQERIETENENLLRRQVAKVVGRFVDRCRCFAQAEGEDGDDDETRIARAIRSERGMPTARMYLLRCSWRAEIPWLPEELCPSITPPDFRLMQYGALAKRALLDELIRCGQHDTVATIASSVDPGDDAFVPQEMESWLSSLGF